MFHGKKRLKMCAKRVCRNWFRSFSTCLTCSRIATATAWVLMTTASHLVTFSCLRGPKAPKTLSASIAWYGLHYKELLFTCFCVQLTTITATRSGLFFALYWKIKLERISVQYHLNCAGYNFGQHITVFLRLQFVFNSHLPRHELCVLTILISV